MKAHRTAFKGTSKEVKCTEIKAEGGPVCEKEEPLIPIRKVKVTHPSLRRRDEPNGNILGVITDQGEYDIYEMKDNWGRLEDGSWISLQFTRKILEQKI